ncbi:MAG: response regulator [Nitrospirae bacterium]|nr:response regulator [Nitrospirota bacterium]
MSQDGSSGWKQPDKRSFIRHELRTPINAIIGYSEMLLEETIERGDAASHLRLDLENINTAGRELLAIVNDTKLEIDLENFGSNFRHAIRTMITTVVGYTEMLLEDSQDSSGETFANDLMKIQSASKQLFALIEDFVKIGNMDAKKDGVEQPTADSSSHSLCEIASTVSLPADETGLPEQMQGTILVVDDNEMNRDLLSRLLKKQGYDCESAENGRLAIEKMRLYKFDLVLLDVIMPEMDGFETLEEIKGADELRYIPVIMISSLDDMDNIVRCIEIGAEDYLPKPPDPVLLRARVSACLEKKRLIDLQIESRKRLKELNEALDVRNRLIRDTFGRYLSDEIVENILETPAGLKLGGEKRETTILMSDLRGFTSIAERLSPEDVVAMINIYLEIMTDIILKYNGTIDEFIGDAILVIFGAPVQRDDDTIRAVACAVEMQTAMEEVNRRNRESGYPEVVMGIGINTGSVVVGNIGSRKRTKYAVVGRNVNLTSRIESYTVGGQILASQSTVDACGEILRIDNTMEVMPKGVQKPITIYEVGGIGSNYNLFLPEIKRTELREIERPLLVYFNVLDGKNVVRESFKGRIVKMSGTEAEIHAEVITDRLSNIKITLASAGSNNIAPEIYAKVTENISAVPPVFRVCLTSDALPVKTFMKAAYFDGKKDSHVMIKFLGVGSQFSGYAYYHSNVLITARSGKNLLIDCGGDIRFSLEEADIKLENLSREIDAVYISHLHSDHIGGLETIALSAYFNPADRKPKLFAEEKLIRRLWLDSLKGGLQCIQGRCMEIDDYFECHPVQESGAFIWEEIKFRLMKMPHIQSGQRDHDSYGLIIEEQNEGANVFFTADTQFRPELIKEMADKVDIIFHDCETTPFKTGVHAHYEELCTLPEDVKRKIWLYHYQPDPDYNAEADGFMGFVIKSQEFEIKCKP